MATKKLSVLLGLRDKTEKTQENMLSDMLGKFKTKQGLFKGARLTYAALEGYADEPSKRGFQNVASTVSEQLGWFKEHTKDHFGIIFSIEKTNANGVTADLVVDGQNWGAYTTLELLRLKSVLDSKMKGMIHEIPIRSESFIWDKSNDPLFTDREIFETPLEESFAKTTLKETVIVNDPHADKPGRAPVSAEKSSQVNIGKHTSQSFSGEYTTKQRADLMVKYDKLYTAVVEALENANNVESQVSDLGDKVLEFLF